MSYEVNVDGGFRIEPVLSRAEEEALLGVMECQNDEGDACPWELTEEADEIVPTDHETKRSIAEWLVVLVAWLVEKGHVVMGEATWEAEDVEDMGQLVVAEGKVQVYRGKVVYELDKGDEQ